jgi:hypothetical protein
MTLQEEQEEFVLALEAMLTSDSRLLRQWAARQLLHYPKGKTE